MLWHPRNTGADPIFEVNEKDLSFMPSHLQKWHVHISFKKIFRVCGLRDALSLALDAQRVIHYHPQCFTQSPTWIFNHCDLFQEKNTNVISISLQCSPCGVHPLILHQIVKYLFINENKRETDFFFF